MSPLGNRTTLEEARLVGWAARGVRVAGLLAIVGWLAMPAFPGVGSQAGAAPIGIARPFAATWSDLDGAATLGPPVTAPIERDGDLVQYFALGILRGSADGRRVQRVAAGYMLASETYDPGTTVAGRRAGGDRGSLAFVAPAGGFAVDPAIAADYERLGGGPRFGEPISEAMPTGDSWTQWFAYGRLVWRNDEPAEPALDGWLAARRSGTPVSETVDLSAPLPSPTLPRELDLPPAGFAPVTIAAPAIGLEAAIEQVGIVDGVMRTPADAWNVGWYADLARPGRPGNVVFAGHKDWWGIGPTIFADLHLLEPGDEIVLTGRNGEVAVYVVSATWLVGADENFARVIAGDEDREEITLITCAGSFDGAAYEDRLVVRGVRVS